MHSETNLQLIQILEKTISPDKNELETAEKFLVHAAATDLAQFIKMLSDVLAQGGNSQVARMAAGLQLKNHLTSKDTLIKHSYQQRWLTFPDQIRFYIKKNIFAALGTENSRPSSAAQCVAYVAVAELPVGQWNDLIAQLVDNIVNPLSTEMQKEASLEAIGYICQDIDSEVLVEQCNQILTAIIHGMRSSEPSNYVRLAATMALHNSLEFTKANFDKENERNFIMEVVCEATQSGDVRISVAALQCLVKILSLYYHFMEPYMAQALFPITLEAMKSDIDEVALQGIEFWSNVSDEEIDLGIEESEAMETGCPPVRTSRHYAKGALQYLTPVLIHKLTKQEDALDEWNPCKAASVCLMLLANCCEDEILPYVLPFVEEHIKSEDWRFRDAALMALGNILGGLQTETAKPLAERAMPVLIELAYDPNVNVRDTTTWTLGRICEVVPEAVLNETYFKPLLECLVHGLSAEPQVAANVCWVFSGLAEAAYEAAKTASDSPNPETYLMSDCFSFIVERLLQNTDRNDASQNNLRSSAYEALMEMVKHSPKDCYGTVQQATMVVLDRLQQVLQAEKQASAHGERSHFNELLGLLCATLQSLLVKVTPEDAPQISDTVMGAVLTILGSNGGKADGVQEEAMLVVSGLVEVLQDGFLKYMDVFKGYLYLGLKNHRDQQVCEMTVGLVSDICRALKTRVLPYCDDLMTLLLENLQDSSIRRSVKPPVFSVFGDIAMNIGREFHKYLDVVMKMLYQASQVPMERTDADTVAHLHKLRESVIEAYTGIVQGFKEDRPYGDSRTELGVLERYVVEIVNFVVAVGADPERTDSQAAALAGLIGDLCSFGPPVLPLLEVKPIIDVLTAGRRSQINRTKITANWATKEMRKLKNSAPQVPASW